MILYFFVIDIHNVIHIELILAYLTTFKNIAKIGLLQFQV